MSLYDHKVMQDLHLGQWGTPPALRNWELEREATRLKPKAKRATNRRSLLRRLRAYFAAPSREGNSAAR